MVVVTGVNHIYVASLDRMTGEGLSGKGHFPWDLNVAKGLAWKDGREHSRQQENGQALKLLWSDTVDWIMTVFDNRASKDIITVSEVLRVRPWFTRMGVLRNALSISWLWWGHGEKVAFCEPGRGLSPEIELVGTLTLDFSGSRTWEDKILSFKPPSQWYLFMAAQPD